MAGEQGYKAGFASPRVAPAPVSTQTPSGAEQPWSPVHSAVMQFDEQHEAATAGTLRDSEGNVVIMRTNFWWSARGMDALYLIPPGRGGRGEHSVGGRLRSRESERALHTPKS